MSDPSQVESIFFAALEKKSAAEWAAYLDETCGDDDALRRRVEQLLDAHPKAADFLAQPAVDRREFDSIDAAEDPTGLAPTGGSEAIPGDPMAGTVPSERTSLETLGGTAAFASETSPGTELCAGESGLTGRSLRSQEPRRRPAPADSSRARSSPAGTRCSRVIGEGGMGTVCRADQPSRSSGWSRVKLIKVGMDIADVLARFEAERQALAVMDHPHHCQRLDAGATDDGQPFFVMELVKGVPITDYCDRNRLTSAPGSSCSCRSARRCSTPTRRGSSTAT